MTHDEDWNELMDIYIQLIKHMPHSHQLNMFNETMFWIMKNKHEKLEQRVSHRIQMKFNLS